LSPFERPFDFPQMNAEKARMFADLSLAWFKTRDWFKFLNLDTFNAVLDC